MIDYRIRLIGPSLNGTLFFLMLERVLETSRASIRKQKDAEMTTEGLLNAKTR